MTRTPRACRLPTAATSRPHAHYGGNLVDGAYVLALFGDVATEVPSAPTATSASSPPTPTSSSSPRCLQETS